MKFVYFLLCLVIFPLANAQDLDSLNIELAQSQSDSISSRVNVEIGFVHMYDSPDSARLYFLEALRLAQIVGDSLPIASCLTYTGITYFLKGKFERATDYYLRALAISEKTENSRNTGIISNNIGAVYFEMKEYEKAQKYYHNATELFEIVKDTFWLSNALNNMGNVLDKTHQYKEGLAIYQKSLDLARKSKNDEAVGSAMSNLGNVYMFLGNYKQAMQQYEAGVVFQQKANDRVGEAITYNNIGRLLAIEGRFLASSKYHLKALVIAEDIGHLETIKNAKKWLSEAYNGMGNFAKAYQTQAQFIILNDSLVGLEKASAVEELNQKYESEQKERTIAELELDQKNAALALATSNNQRNLFIFGFLILTVLAVLLFILFRNKRKSLAERDILLKEIHHRVKNNLQVISSLLNLQAGSLDDEAAKDAVKEGQHRVKSMALIHQRLYSADDIRGVDIQDYFENLTQALFNAFGVQHIDYQINASGLKLDIDTVIPIGLIVNELITNAIKYAFNDSEQGLLQISMSEADEKIQLTIQDSGEGMDEETMKTANSFGWKMIRSLSRKLKAEINIVNDQGTTVHLTLHKYKLVI